MAVLRRRSASSTLIGGAIETTPIVAIVIVFVVPVERGRAEKGGGAAAERVGLVNGIGEIQIVVQQREIVLIQIHFFLARSLSETDQLKKMIKDD